MISDHTLQVFERIAQEAGMTRREVVEEFNEPTEKIASEPIEKLEQRLRVFFGLAYVRHSQRTQAH